MNQPITLAAAAILNVIIGLSGLFVGLTLVVASIGIAVPSDTPTAAALGIVVGILIYGVLAIAGGVGVWRRSRRGWWLALLTDAAGLSVLIWSLAVVGRDVVLMFGVVVWAIALTLLLAPDTRRWLRLD